ncbi:MAG TPA: pyrimidine reductase [Anaerolineae bacterium]|nr:pyrimidine reductase [Anaerolineae bacterium]HIP73859.1 pyrimidine reductase [Anaerolineae bacterium]
MDSVTQLHPLPAPARPLPGLYLSHNLRQHEQETFVYSNFVTSLDGRIAIPHPDKPGMMVPPQTANARDWRLFQELAVQADIIITSGRYLRDYADGRAQEILRVYDDPDFADLGNWRREQGLSPQPDLAVISGSLNFPIPEVLTAHGRKVIIFTTAQADRQRVQELEAQAGQVVVAGEESVDGRSLVQQMAQMGYRTIYSATGPKVLHLLLAAGVLDRLYLTLANRILGGRPFSSIVEGPLLEPTVDMTLHTLYYDAAGLDGLGQLFAAYRIA